MPLRARDKARALISTASISSRSGETPASSSAMANEYGSSPEEHGKLSKRTRLPGCEGSHSNANRTRALKGSTSLKNQVSATTTDSVNAFHSVLEERSNRE